MDDVRRQIELLRAGNFCEWSDDQLADALERLVTASAEGASKQAKIDALMLEYCPDEMTPEQLEEWGRNQVPSASNRLKCEHRWSDPSKDAPPVQCTRCGVPKVIDA